MLATIPDVPPPPDDREWAVIALGATEGLYDRNFISEDLGYYAVILSATGLKARFQLKAILALHDARLTVEASATFRAFTEVLITLLWIEVNPERNFLRWEHEDIRSRLAADSGLRKHGGSGMSPETITGWLERRRIVRRELDALGFDWRDRRRGSYPSVEKMANDAERPLPYDSIYRMESQIGTHLRSIGLQVYVDEVPRGSRLRRAARPGAPIMRVCAALYLDILDTIGRMYPDMQPRGSHVENLRRLIRAGLPAS